MPWHPSRDRKPVPSHSFYQGGTVKLEPITFSEGHRCRAILQPILSVTTAMAFVTGRTNTRSHSQRTSACCSAYVIRHDAVDTADPHMAISPTARTAIGTATIMPLVTCPQCWLQHEKLCC